MNLDTTINKVKFYYNDYPSIDNFTAAAYLLHTINGPFEFLHPVFKRYVGESIESLGGDISPDDDDYEDTEDVKFLANLFFKSEGSATFKIKPITLKELNDKLENDYVMDSSTVGIITFEIEKNGLYLHMNKSFWGDDEDTYNWSTSFKKPKGNLTDIIKENKHTNKMNRNILLFEQFVTEKALFKSKND
jgi:hypothetical protein